jgi:hypothetical protein
MRSPFSNWAEQLYTMFEIAEKLRNLAHAFTLSHRNHCQAVDFVHCSLMKRIRPFPR